MKKLEATIEVTVAELERMLQSPDRPLLLDVRKPWEAGICRLEGSLLIPLDALPVRLDEIDRDREVIVYCHHGVRSLMAADYLIGHGYRARSLAGGIDAWARETETGMTKY